jgi:hypothetical protein
MLKFIQTVLSVGAIAFLLYIFTFFMDGEMGMILIAFMVVAPAVSLFFTAYSRKRVKVSFKCDAYVQKGSELEITVKIEKTGRLPLPVVEITPWASEVFEKQSKIYRSSLLTENTREFSFRVKAKTGGNGTVGIKSLYCCGFLGFLKLRAKTALPEDASVGVIPEIPDVKAASQLFRKIADVVLTSDEEEASNTAMLFSSNTSPGYEYREYVNGDSLKRVNWKLSTKRDTLMVRMDEAAASVQPMIVLDLFRKKGAAPEYAVITEEKLLRGVFGLLNLLVKQGIACNFIYKGGNGEPVMESVDNPDYPAQLLLKVLAVKVTEEYRNVPVITGKSVCAGIVATTDAGPGIAAVTAKFEDPDSVSILGVSAESLNSTGLPMWYLTDDDNFELV